MGDGRLWVDLAGNADDNLAGELWGNGNLSVDLALLPVAKSPNRRCYNRQNRRIRRSFSKKMIALGDESKINQILTFPKKTWY